ncbi:DMT family transporter [Amycolatopsis sp. K13G38]|uniref:DMT family transporter n=1 Tax=Amycolatopsis acididurans TaxID=2724524 RepID=A0ABX1IZH6_9PSEU|nr:DMT family transporter [Amycolatopsis acididurans]NKQ52907.1 DMT family transporter [Amycolatopsis acididurans]
MSTFVAAPARGRSATALILAGVLWGTGGLSGNLLAAQGHLHPLSVACYRLLLGGACTVLFVWATGRLRELVWTKPVVRRLLMSGALLGQFQACYFVSVSLTSVSVSTMITIGSVPVFATLGTAVRDRRLPATTTLGATAAAIAGLVLLTWSPVAGSWKLAGGVAFALLAGAGFAMLTLATRKPVEGLDSFCATAFGLLLGGVALTPVALWFGMALPLRPEVLAIALYLGVVPTAIAYAAYFLALRTAHPVLAALSALLEPLTAVVASAVLFGDRLGVTGWCGAALLVTALAVSYTR